ncbi:MAG TPA: MMPL family transporter [Thermoleophilaceae bacterium]
MAIWLVVIGLLALRGIGVEDRLSTVALWIPGTPSKEAQDFKESSFGDQDYTVVLLQGPPKEVERQGKRLTRATAKIKRTTAVVSPWSGGETIEGLRPSPKAAALIVNLRRYDGELYPDILPPLERTIDEVVEPPVTASLGSQAVIAKHATSEAERAAKRAELLAFPVLAIVLFLVFGSPVAAAIPGLIGGATVQAGRGVIDLLYGPVEFDALAPGITAMVGLALGIDYTLLIVSRYREEVARGLSPPEAAEAAVATAGRAAIFAGFALFLTMLVASQILPGAIVVSTAIAVMIASVFSVAAAIFVAPALLVIAAPYLDRFSIYGRSGRRGGMSRLSAALTRRPVLASALVALLLLGGSVQAFAVDSGPPSTGLLPPDNEGRKMHRAVERVLGPGFGGTFEVLVDGGSKPVTTPGRLRRLARFERTVRRDPGVFTVAGLARIEEQTEQLRRVPQQIDGLTLTLKEGRRGLERLDGGLGLARGGARDLESGLRAAAAGSDLLHGGTGQTELGARLLRDGTRAAAVGSQRLLQGMRLAQAGAGRLARGAGSAAEGSDELQEGIEAARVQAPGIAQGGRRLETALRGGADQLGRLREPIGIATDELIRAWDGLQAMTIGKADPLYPQVVEAVGRARGAVTGRDPRNGEPVQAGYDGLDAAIVQAQSETHRAADGAALLAAGGDRLVDGLVEIEDGAERLVEGIETLARGNRRLAGALEELTGGGAQLAPGLDLLAFETGRLARGLEEIDDGTGRLARELRSGAARAPQLSAGIQQMLDGVAAQRRKLPNGGIDISRINRESPGFFRSGYFYLSSVDGAADGTRRRAGLVVNLDRGGHAARMSIIPTTAPLHPDSAATRKRIEKAAAKLERDTGMKVRVGGEQAALADFNDEMRSAVPIATLALALVTLLVLVPILRSLLLPLAAVLLNVLTVGATFGVMALLFNDSLLGGPGYMDTFTLGIILTVLFGLAIDYEVFVLARMREEYLRTGDTHQAIVNGIDGTARVVTGAAIIMMAVFLAFSTSGFISMRNVGVGLAVGVFIDAFLIRMLALPGLMRMLGPWAWWLPGWLDRILPNVNLEPPSHGHAPARPAAEPAS